MGIQQHSATKKSMFFENGTHPKGRLHRGSFEIDLLRYKSRPKEGEAFASSAKLLLLKSGGDNLPSKIAGLKEHPNVAVVWLWIQN